MTQHKRDKVREQALDIESLQSRLARRYDDALSAEVYRWWQWEPKSTSITWTDSGTAEKDHVRRTHRR